MLIEKYVDYNTKCVFDNESTYALDCHHGSQTSVDLHMVHIQLLNIVDICCCRSVMQMRHISAIIQQHRQTIVESRV